MIVHPRTADQGFGGKANWDIIKAVKEAVNIPVIGNGDIRSADDASRMVQTTGCDGVMIGRGALGNPWLMGEILARLTGSNTPVSPSLVEKEGFIERHLAMETGYYGEGHGCRNFRKHLLWYTKGLPEGAKFRNLASALGEKEAMLKELRRFFRLSPDADTDNIYTP